CASGSSSLPRVSQPSEPYRTGRLLPSRAMTLEANKALVRRYLDEVWNARRLDAADELVAPGYVALPGEKRGPDSARALVELFLGAFPDFSINVVDVVAEGAQVVVRYEFEGTHRGHWLGVAATGRRVTVAGVTIYRLAEQRIAETWFLYDAMRLLQ